MKFWRILLLVVAVLCIGVAVSYPIRYQLALRSNNTELEELSAMRMRVRDAAEDSDEAQAGEDAEGQPENASGVPEASQSGADQSGADQSIADQFSTDQSGADQSGADQSGADQSGADRPKAGQPETGQPEAGPEIAEGLSQAAGSKENPAAQSISEEGTSDDRQPDAEGYIQPVQDAPETRASEAADLETMSPGTMSPEAMSPETEPSEAELHETMFPETMSPETMSPGTMSPGTMSPGTTSPSIAQETFAPSPTRTPGIMDLIINDPETPTPSPSSTPSPTPTPTLTPSPSPSPTPDRSIRSSDVLAYPYKEKVSLDEERILPELKDIYALNSDLVGWIYIEDTLIDYPVVQSEDREYYLKHDFYGKNNANGQIILDTKCDPYTPSYNLIISGHHMNSGAMFGRLPRYRDKKYWETHKIIEFDTLMERKKYVIFAVFYSADYDEDEEGFRYNADIQYKLEADAWLEEIRQNQVYDTGIDVEFGDEFITLTTCDRSRRRNGRFVAVARRIRKGEKFE